MEDTVIEMLNLAIQPCNASLGDVALCVLVAFYSGLLCSDLAHLIIFCIKKFFRFLKKIQFDKTNKNS